MVFRLSEQEKILLLSEEMPEQFRESIFSSIEKLCNEVLQGKFPERLVDRSNRENVLSEGISLYLNNFRLRFPSKNLKQASFAKELYKNLPDLIRVEAEILGVDVERLRFNPNESLDERIRRRLIKWKLFVKMLAHAGDAKELTS